MPPIAGGETRASRNARRLGEAARLLDVPVLATEQNPTGLGGNVARDRRARRADACQEFFRRDPRSRVRRLPASRTGRRSWSRAARPMSASCRPCSACSDRGHPVTLVADAVGSRTRGQPRRGARPRQGPRRRARHHRNGDLRVARDERPPALPGGPAAGEVISDPLFYAAAVPAVILMGLSKGRLLRDRPPLLAADGARRLAGAGRGHHAADPDGAGRGHRVVVPTRLGPAQPRDPSALLQPRHPDRLSACREGLGRRCGALGRRDLHRLRASAHPRRARRAAPARAGRPSRRLLLGHRDRLHQHDRPCRRAAVPDLRHAAAPAARRLRRHGRCCSPPSTGSRCRPMRRSASSRPRTSRPRPPLRRSPSPRPAPGVRLVRRVPAERFYGDRLWTPAAVGGKLVHDGWTGF